MNHLHRCQQDGCYHVRSKKYLMKMPWGLFWCIPCVLWWCEDNKGKEAEDGGEKRISEQHGGLSQQKSL